jgi:hypothetical protein
VTASSSPPERLTRDQLRQLQSYANYISDGRLASLVMRALDGDSLYHNSIMERCAAAYAGAHRSDEFKRANRAGHPQRKPRRRT